MLLGESFSSMKTLEKKLRLYESRSQPTRGDDDGREPTSSKDRDRCDRGSSRSRSTCWAYQSNESDSEYRDSRSREEGRRVHFEDDDDQSDSDEDAGSTYLAARQQQYGSRPLSPRRPTSSGTGPPSQPHSNGTGSASLLAPANVAPVCARNRATSVASMVTGRILVRIEFRRTYARRARSAATRIPRNSVGRSASVPTGA